MTRPQLVRSLALWTARERRYYLRWRGLKKQKAGIDVTRDAWRAWNHAHQMRVRRTVEIRKLDATSWRIDDTSAEAIIQREGISLWAYPDSQGWATGGVGHLITPPHKGVTAADFEKWGSRAHPIARDKAVSFFRDVDLVPYEKVVDDANRKRVANGHEPITPAQRGACVSLAFNIGTGGFATSTVARLIAKGASASAVADAFLLWHQPPEIMGRRRSEAAQYRAG